MIYRRIIPILAIGSDRWYKVRDIASYSFSLTPRWSAAWRSRQKVSSFKGMWHIVPQVEEWRKHWYRLLVALNREEFTWGIHGSAQGGGGTWIPNQGLGGGGSGRRPKKKIVTSPILMEKVGIDVPKGTSGRFLEFKMCLSSHSYFLAVKMAKQR